MTMFETMIRDGGNDGHAIVMDAESHAKKAIAEIKRLQRLSKNGVLPATEKSIRAVADTFTRIFDFWNTLFRFATYRASIEAGISPEDAARLARRSTLDLTRKGEWSPNLDDFYFFANPAIQSAIKQKQMFKSRNGRRVMAMFVTAGALTSFWNQMVSGDDDDDGIKNYDNIDRAKKMANFIFQYGPGADEYVALPLGFMVGFPFYLGQKMTEVATGIVSPSAASASLLENAIDVAGSAVAYYSPVKFGTQEVSDVPASLVPTMLQTPVQLYRNKDFWGKPIYDDPLFDTQSKSSNGRENTADAYKWFAQAMNDVTGGSGQVAGTVDFAPEQYRYAVMQATGGPGRALKSVVNIATGQEEDLTKLPVLSSYLGSGGEYQAQNLFYQRNTRLKQVKSAYKDGDEEAIAALEKQYPVDTDPSVLDAYDAAVKELSKIGKDRKEELEGVEDPKERREIIESFKPDRDAVYAEFNRVYNDAKVAYRRD